MANHQFGLCRSCATIDLPASSACNDFAENSTDARAPSCFKVQKPSRTARSRRHGLSFPARGQVIFPGCAARAVLKATLEKGPTDGWIIGSNDVGSCKTFSCSQKSCCRFALEWRPTGDRHSLFTPTALLVLRGDVRTTAVCFRSAPALSCPRLQLLTFRAEIWSRRNPRTSNKP